MKDPYLLKEASNKDIEEGNYIEVYPMGISPEEAMGLPSIDLTKKVNKNEYYSCFNSTLNQKTPYCEVLTTGDNPVTLPFRRGSEVELHSDGSLKKYKL
jgi:hypothetical protein